MSWKLPYRQVHLDFHTSPAIAGIGAAFNKRQWQETLKRGHVNSITTFALCHHGWSYYDTKVGKRHPGLSFDLLRAQYEASKEIGVNVPIYLTAGVNSRVADERPEWRETGVDGAFLGWNRDLTQPGFKTLCFNSPYLDHLCEQIAEVVELFPNCDGIFLDIISQAPCCCKWCLESMREQGLKVEVEADRATQALRSLDKYFEATTAAAKSVRADMPIFHNSGHITRGNRRILKHFSHLELESLPTGGWGYDHFPVSARYCANLGLDFLGMTGKFHTTWGEFGGYKHPNALRYECAAMVAMGAKCSVGDQAHPNASLDASSYEIIGAAYAEIEAKEPWLEGARGLADIGLVSSAAVNSTHESNADIGAARVLLEAQFLFDVLDAEMDFSPYKLLILPDDIKVGPALKTKLDAYLAAGGKMLLTGDSGLAPDGSGLLWDVGAKLLGKSPFEPDYALPVEPLRPAFVASPLVMYLRSNRLKATDGESLGKVVDPYFNRDFRHFCSHQHTPPDLAAAEFDCGVAKGNLMYLAHPVFTLYRCYGAVAYKDYCAKAIKRLLDGGVSLESNLPSTARATLTEQAAQKRYVLHLLYASTVARGGALPLSGGNVASKDKIEIIEDLVPLHDVEVTLSTPKPVRRATLEPQGKELPLGRRGGKVVLKIDKFECHQMVALHY